MPTNITLKRSISLPLLTLYGLGTIIGAGIYVLVGEVAQLSGLFSPLAFIVAAVIAVFTAFTYAELSSRYPKSAGEACYVQNAFSRTWFAGMTGWSVIFIGIISAATMVNGFVGYFQVFFQVPEWLVISLLVMTMALIAAWGINETVWVAAVITLIEIGGLVYVIVVSYGTAYHSEVNMSDILPGFDRAAWSGIVLGSFLAFYAYIGFEDMVNIAEEVKQPRRNLPLSIMLALVVSTVLYVAVSIIAVLVLPLDQLASSHAPLKDIVSQSSSGGAVVISLVSMVAVVNGALIQLILASRVLYGMARQGIAPAFLANVHASLQTPLWATALATLVILVLALGFSVVSLATATSFITLLVFATMHASLVMIKRRSPDPAGAKTYPAWVPVCGLLLTVVLVIYKCIELLK